VSLLAWTQTDARFDYQGEVMLTIGFLALIGLFLNRIPRSRYQPLRSLYVLLAAGSWVGAFVSGGLIYAGYTYEPCFPSLAPSPDHWYCGMKGAIPGWIVGVVGLVVVVGLGIRRVRKARSLVAA